MTKKPIILLLLCFALCMASVTGCKTTNPTPSPSPSLSSRPSATPMTSPSPATSPEMSPEASTTPGGMENGNDSKLSMQASEEVGMMSEMENAAILISGTTALVAVQYDTQYKGGVTERLQTAVEEKITKVAPDVTETIITDDPEMFTQIKDLQTKWSGGEEWSTLKDAFESLLDKLKPANSGTDSGSTGNSGT